MTEAAAVAQPDSYRHHFEFVTTAQMSVDAQSAAGSLTLSTFHLIGDTALIVVGVVFGLAGYVLGYLMIIFGVLFLFVSQVAPFRRWLIRRHTGDLLGQRVTIDIDDDSLRYSSPLSSSTLPWTTVTAVRASNNSVVLLRGKIALGYVPAAAFAHDRDRLEFVDYARRRAAANRAASTTAARK